MENIKPKISIVIPAKNAAKTIAKCLSSLKALDYPSYEIIIIDDGSTDATEEIVKSFSGVTLLKSGGAGPSKARNIGIDKATGEYIAFTDSDCVVDKQWLSELLKGFTLAPVPLPLAPVVAVGGDQQSPSDDSEFGRKVHGFLKLIGFTADYVKGDGKKIIATPHNPSCNVMYRAGVLKSSGGFLEGLWPGEDLELDYRLHKQGFTFLYNPGAVVFHYRPGTMELFKKMMFNYGRVQAVLMRKYGPFRFIHYVPFILLSSAMALVLTPVVLSIPFCAALFVLVWFYLVVKSKKISTGFSSLHMLAVMLVYWNTGFLKGLADKNALKAKS